MTKAPNMAKLEAALDQAAKAEPPRPPTGYETVVTLLPRIQALKSKRYTDAEILDLLKENGVEMSLGTFRQYYQRATRDTGATPTRTRKQPAGERKAKENANATPKPSELASAPRATTGEGKKNLGHKLGDDDV